MMCLGLCQVYLGTALLLQSYVIVLLCFELSLIISIGLYCISILVRS